MKEDWYILDQIECPKCGARLKFKDKEKAKRERSFEAICPDCGGLIRVGQPHR